MTRHACPKCQSTTGFWRAVLMSGWIDIDTYLEQQGRPEDDGAYFDLQDEFGCTHCGWRGFERQLIKLGIDDAPLPIIHPLQMSLGVAA